MTNKKTLVLSVSHSFDLIFFLRLVRESTIKQDYSLKIIFQEHDYFDGKFGIAKKIFKEISDDVILVKKAEIPGYGRNIIKNLLLALKFRKILIKDACESDTLLILDKSTYKANILLSYFKNSILFQFPNGQTNAKKYILDYKENILIKIYHRMLNLHPVEVRKLRDAEKLIQEYFVDLPRVKKLYITHANTPDSIRFSSNIKKSSSRKIVMFGSRYLEWNLEKETIKKIHTYYKNIYNEFKDEVKFLYIAHPLEKGREFGEVSSLFESNIKKETSYLNTEHFLLENLDVIHCFSIGSTSSKSAYQMGFNSKVAYKSLLSETRMIDGFERIFEDVTDNIHIDYECIEDIRKQLVPMQVEANFNKLYEVIQ
jgi:hypothetical protein